jgi:hypothetical protein
MGQTDLERGRAAYDERAWDTYVTALREADEAGELPPEDLKLLAIACFLAGRPFRPAPDPHRHRRHRPVRPGHGVPPRSLGQPCLVVHEHARVGDQWRRRYDSLLLNTPAQYDNLPGMRFPAPKHSFPSGADMAAYLEAYVEMFGIDVRHRTMVLAIDRQRDGTFLVDCGNSTIVADNVVVATGGEHHPQVPELGVASTRCSSAVPAQVKRRSGVGLDRLPA